MTIPLRTPKDYELFLYTLIEQFPAVRRSTVTFVRRGASLARVVGELHFDQDIRLVVRERIRYALFGRKSAAPGTLSISLCSYSHVSTPQWRLSCEGTAVVQDEKKAAIVCPARMYGRYQPESARNVSFVDNPASIGQQRTRLATERKRSSRSWRPLPPPPEATGLFWPCQEVGGGASSLG